MSVLHQLFNRGVLGARCKTCLNLSISRIKLLQNRRDGQLQQMRKEIAQFMQTGQEAIARIRVEHVIREQNIWAAYEILEMFCEFVLARVPILEGQMECPPELREAIASIIFAAPRCSDLPDLLQVKNLFATKYGKGFVSAVSELRPDTSVNRTIIEKLSVSTPAPDVKLKVLKDIAKEYNINWDSSETEAELNKKHDDLLDGSKPIREGVVLSAGPLESPSNGKTSPAPSTLSARTSTSSLESSNHINNTQLLNSNGTHPTTNENGKDKVGSQSSNILEKAREAIYSADQASAAARAASQLVNVKFRSLDREESEVSKIS